MKRVMIILSLITLPFSAIAETFLVENTGGSSYKPADQVISRGCIRSVQYLKGVSSLANGGSTQALTKVNLANCSADHNIGNKTIIFAGEDVSQGLALSSAIGKQIIVNHDGGEVLVFTIE